MHKLNREINVQILLLCYNSESTILKTIDSILNQTHSNFEIHVLDSNSTDKSLELVGSISDPRIFIHKSSKSLSGYENYDRALQMSKGKYTCIFHSDDEYLPKILEKQIAYLEANKDVGIVFTQAFKINENSKITGKLSYPFILKILTVFNYHLDILSLLKLMFRYNNFCICPSAMARSSLYKEYLISNRTHLFKSAADVDNWIRISEKFKIGFLLDRLIRYRISTTQFSYKNAKLVTHRSHIFLVLNYYKLKYYEKLNSFDKFNLTGLKITDYLIRVNNIKDNISLVKDRLNRIHFYSILMRSCSGVKAFKAFILYIYLRVKVLFLYNNK